jgi:hypothetical protein
MASVTPAGFVRHGSVYVDRTIDRDFTKAETYLRGDAVERGIFDKLEGAAKRLYVVGNARDDDHFDANANAVFWDPHSALRTTQGGGQSPALGLGHELDHAACASAARAIRAATPDVDYQNKEERRVIRGSEAHAAATLGESSRYDHAGRTYRVASPLAH